jgi:formamidopyrimidine-DNA glycosylase
MPESPEVRRTYEDVISIIEDKTITSVEVLGGRFEKKQPVGMNLLITPIRVTGGGVKGKFMWFELGDSCTMWVTLGMSGRWSTEPEKHSHFRLEFTDSTTVRNLYFVDQRRFGTIKFSGSRAELQKKLDQLGVDLLNDQVTFDQFKSKLNGQHKKTICEALMNQKVCAGVGNYIKCEVLYRSKISPYRKVDELTEQQLKTLYYWISLIMRSSYEQGGASIRNYRRVNGNLGNFVFEFEVYAQRTDPLGNAVVREATPDKRTTHWVPSEQF